MAEQQTYQYSGVYDVRETTKNRKVFESSSTIAYPGQLVRIVMETE